MMSKKESPEHEKKESTSFQKRVAVVLVLLCLFTLGILSYFFFHHPFQAQVVTIRTGNDQIAYYTRGNGTPVLLIEGFGMSMEDYDPAFIEELAKDHQVIVYDLPGVGLSQADPKMLNFQTMGEDTLGLLDALKIEKADIIGWSMGSVIAQDMAIQNPDRVGTLILASTFPADKSTIDSTLEVDRYVADHIGDDFASSLVKIMFPNNQYGKELLQQYLQRRQKAITSGESPRTPGDDVKVKVAQEVAMAALQNEDRISLLKTIKAKTLILAGDRDDVVPLQNDQKVKDAIPGAKLIVIPRAGHAVLFENSAIVKESINRFLTE